MIKTQMLVIAVAAIVVTASVGVVLVFMNDNDDNRIRIDAALEVYGNANNDGVIDQADIELIQNIIAGIESFEDYPLADANCDGVIDEKDIELVNKIINADSNNKVTINILNRYGEGKVIETVQYPITSAAVTGEANTLLVFKYLGIVNEVKGLSWGSSLDSLLFSEYTHLMTEDQKLASTTTSMDPEMVSKLVTSDAVTAIITIDNVNYVTNAGTVFKTMKVDTVRVATAAVDTEDYLSTILMVAFLFDTDGKGYINKCAELITWYKDFFNDLNEKLSKVVNKVSAVASSSTTRVSSGTSDYTAVLLAAGATYALGDWNFNGASTATYDGNTDNWLNAFEMDYIISLRTSVENTFSWYQGDALTKGSAILKSYMENFRTMKCFIETKNVYIVCGEMPVPMRIAYVAEILYPDIFGEDFAYNYHVDFVKKFFGWDEDKIKNKPFVVTMADLGLA